MRSETRESLAKARECLAAAKTILGVSLSGVAAKEGYLAAYHAAHAFVIERTGKPVKTHRGLRIAYARAARDEPKLDPDFGPTVEITIADAQAVIGNAEQFIDAVARTLASADT